MKWLKVRIRVSSAQAQEWSSVAKTPRQCNNRHGALRHEIGAVVTGSVLFYNTGGKPRRTTAVKWRPLGANNCTMHGFLNFLMFGIVVTHLSLDQHHYT
jgi:hypothetical protein